MTVYKLSSIRAGDLFQCSIKNKVVYYYDSSGWKYLDEGGIIMLLESVSCCDEAGGMVRALYNDQVILIKIFLVYEKFCRLQSE